MYALIKIFPVCFHYISFYNLFLLLFMCRYIILAYYFNCWVLLYEDITIFWPFYYCKNFPNTFSLLKTIQCKYFCDTEERTLKKLFLHKRSENTDKIVKISS